MIALLTNPWVILAVVVGLGVSHGTAFFKGHSYGEAGAELRHAKDKAKAEAEAKVRNRRTEENLRVLVDVQTKARLEAERQSEENRNALAADQTDTTIRVGPDLDRVLGRSLFPGGVPGPGADPGDRQSGVRP
jgi:hypothetical protein